MTDDTASKPLFRSLDILSPTCDRPELWALSMASLTEKIRHAPNIGRLRVVVGDSGRTSLLASPVARVQWEVTAIALRSTNPSWTMEYHRCPVRAGSAPVRDYLLDRVTAEVYYIQDDDIVLTPISAQDWWLCYIRTQTHIDYPTGILLYYVDLFEDESVLDHGLWDSINNWWLNNPQDEMEARTFMTAPHDSSAGFFRTLDVRMAGGYHSSVLGSGSGVDTLHCLSILKAGGKLLAYCRGHAHHANVGGRRVVQRDEAFVRALQSMQLTDAVRDRYQGSPALSLLTFLSKGSVTYDLDELRS